MQKINALESFVIRRFIMGERTRGGSDFAQVEKSESLPELYQYVTNVGGLTILQLVMRWFAFPFTARTATGRDLF